MGYDAIDRKLVINKNEAQVVKRIYEEYNGGATVKTIAADPDAKNIRSKPRKNGKGEKKFSRGAIYKILSNPVYCGQVAHGKFRYEGEHEAIINRITWEKTADRLEAGKRRECAGVKYPSPLAGKIWADSEPMTPTHANKNGRRYRYYVSRSRVETGASATAGWRLPASEVETAVSDLIREWLKICCGNGHDCLVGPEFVKNLGIPTSSNVKPSTSLVL